MSLLGCNFKASALNMGEVSFDSISTIKGMIFQFLVALERCFEMQEGLSVYIERFGDVSVISKEDAIQIESKYWNHGDRHLILFHFFFVIMFSPFSISLSVGSLPCNSSGRGC